MPTIGGTSMHHIQTPSPGWSPAWGTFTSNIIGTGTSWPIVAAGLKPRQGHKCPFTPKGSSVAKKSPVRCSVAHTGTVASPCRDFSWIGQMLEIDNRRKTSLSASKKAYRRLPMRKVSHQSPLWSSFFPISIIPSLRQGGKNQAVKIFSAIVTFPVTVSLKSIVNTSEGSSSDGSSQESMTTVRLISKVGGVNLEPYISKYGDWRLLSQMHQAMLITKRKTCPFICHLT